MKRRIVRTLVCAVLVLSVICLAGCGSTVSVGSFSSLFFNADEYDEAVQTVFTVFGEFKGCTMKEIHYAGDKAVRAEAEARGLPVERIMVLESTFTTDGENHENGLEPNHTYENFRWILTRDLRGNPWYHLDHGYC